MLFCLGASTLRWPYGVLLEFLTGIRQISSPIFEHLERFTCVLYDKTMAVSRVKELRQELFSKKVKLIDNIPPFLVCFFHYLWCRYDLYNRFCVTGCTFKTC